MALWSSNNCKKSPCIRRKSAGDWPNATDSADRTFAASGAGRTSNRFSRCASPIVPSPRSRSTSIPPLKPFTRKSIKNGKKVGRNGSIYTVSLISSVLRVTRPIVRQWAGESRLELKSEVRGSVTVQFAEDEEFERFCRKNHNYLIYEVGGRIAPRERIQFLKEFVMAADMPDDHTARSHKREREAYAQQMKPEAEDEDIDENEAQDDQA